MESDHNFYTGLVQDISRGGVFVATHDLRPIGTTYVLRLRLPGVDAGVVAEAVVRWVREASAHSDAPAGMGLQFVALSPEAHAAIHEFLRRRESIFYDVD